MVYVENISNGTESTFTDDQWEKVSKDPRYATAFRVRFKDKTPEPKEVTELKASQEPAAANDTESTKADKPKAVKSANTGNKQQD